MTRAEESVPGDMSAAFKAWQAGLSDQPWAGFTFWCAGWRAAIDAAIDAAVKTSRSLT